jgi:hypothetical protein
VRRAALGLVLFGLYAATLPIPARPGERYAGDEPHHLLAAESLVSDGDLDVANQYAQRSWRRFRDAPLAPSGKAVNGRLHEPQGIGVALLAAPAYALAGARGVEVFLAALMALAFVVALPLARRLVPEPWATAAVLVVAVSPPALAAATTVSAEPAGGALLAGGALCALSVRRRARLRYAYGGALLLALLPWLDPVLALTGVPVAVCLVLWTLRERRRLVALLAAELMLGSLVVYARLNETLYGRPTPGGGPELRFDRLGHVLGLWVDPDVGLLRWAPVLVLTLVGAWLLWRSRRERVGAAIPERREAERAAEMLLAVVAVQWLVAALDEPTLHGSWFPGLPFVPALPAAAALAAWGMRRLRVVGAALAALTVGTSAWLLLDLWIGAPEGWLR